MIRRRRPSLVSRVREYTAPAAPAHRPPADPPHQVAAENVRRLPQGDTPDRDDMKGHAA